LHKWHRALEAAGVILIDPGAKSDEGDAGVRFKELEGEMVKEREMKTYVAEINGEAILAFRAVSDEDAKDQVNDAEGDVRLGLDGVWGALRADGSALWDGESEIIARQATDAEQEEWQRSIEADGIGNQDDQDDHVVYLIPVTEEPDELDRESNAKEG
jgi:hypothetical protein